MHRRGFLAAGLATVLAGPRALAQMKMDGTSNMDSMPGMDMGGHSGHDMGAVAKAPAALPEGEALRELPLLANEAGRPGLFKARLTAESATARFTADQDTPILAYNGMSPGPLIEAYEGDRVEITFANRIAGEASTIHWHGMPVPADQDGNPMDPVAPGADRVYAFDLPEGSAGTYWYHPHPHGRTAEQVYRGLAGAFVVKAKADPIPAAYGDTALVFTDLRLAADGSMPDNTMTDMMNGRVGDHVLVNGQKNPKLAVAMGAKRRLRLYNATNARFLRLAFDNAAMTVIGSDGGLLEKPVAAEEILLSPAERVELVVAFDRPGAATLTTLDYDRGWMGPGRPADAGLTLLAVDVSNTAAEAMPPLPERLRPIVPLNAPTVSRRLVFTETMAMNPTGMEMGFLINGKAFEMGRVDIVARAGDTELWEIVNQADMDHPFHLHGTQFQVVERERGGKVAKPPYLAWKDTVNVARGETVRLLTRQERPGARMYHCHILEHEQLGMMGIVDVRA
ncbi:multicopper oxidase family protein [Mesorhizobium sp. M2D.F.Ca.ET.185.01.1.1]|uniref:multicopper oxidase family protein n=1 Tax=unclassified Mesorhizobium TaxID=325217 RepID=UPI000FCAAF4C|nr:MULTISPECIES: multicopper oxidase family protein [unclassified Mesorhizobium]TGP77062.1 multicopper oxidase family protein [bacterium M00.F.Ca.ET.227.01.1.1]TGP84071.1 multicopper oxidase family protein [bacterium M00.F.Ca.ET.221.01.1.1]TGP88578.1 multicopper oxidase family protein [bacterium M00.F.Ca.ET.222.01.1.1]TGU03144.1 multicopper oxidase family protein [bacterium M00.F.Ca.ET.163.01.1.1]TGU30809.1 multicopper oxidase family protein [bacterium M00.F.Ca.ET.156.01.1.1]TGU45065.1 multic